ncbi:MAG: rod shape-determining protein MreC [Saprospiraceae bacterium]|nr:rod shape-determining protein MreC [Saprospiraceae bacterium]
MGSLLQLFARLGNFLTLLFLEGICLMLIVQGGPKQKDILLNTTGLIVNVANERISNLTSYLNLKQQVAELKNSNTICHNARPGARYDNVLVKDTININDSLYSYIAAEVISRNIYGANNTMILNRGGAHGVEKGMGVISDKGIVGIVEDTSRYFCKVISILHSKSRVSAAVISRDTSRKKNNDTFGVLVWENGHSEYANLTDIPRYHEVAPGDTIMTSGYSFAFPQGHLIGVIESIPGPDPIKTSMHGIKVRLSNDPIRLRHVYIVKMDRKKKEDLLRLEKDGGYEQ